MKVNIGNEKTIVEPVFNDIDLEKSSPINEPPPPYQENESSYSNVTNITTPTAPPKHLNNINTSSINSNPVITTTIIREKCHHKNCCKEELSHHSKNLLCKQCNTIVQSTLSYEKGSRYKIRLIIFILLSIICPIFIICLLVLFLSNKYKDITHRCPYCHGTLEINNSCRSK
uniref:LITAF domain-containing protein n=1 Tax=Strongyloides stercoralis TaxID=6248 RepID=A0A0K0EK63_STRER